MLTMGVSHRTCFGVRIHFLLQIFMILLRHKADPNARDQDDDTPFITLARENKYAIDVICPVV